MIPSVKPILPLNWQQQYRQWRDKHDTRKEQQEAKRKIREERDDE